MRLAPIQITCHGHPVSGQFNQIDYFLSGGLVELPKSVHQYSEKLILLPGSGVLPFLPDYAPKRPAKAPQPVRVAVPWSAIKYNAPMFQCLKTLQDVGAHLVFIPGSPIHRYQASIPVRMAMLDYFGTNITIVPNLPYEKYMSILESCHFTVDSYPFGGYNTVIDSLWCGCPVVSLEGDNWFNRVASYLLRRSQLDELVATSYEQYTEIARMLILDNKMLAKVTQRTKDIDFKYLLNADSVEDFVLAIDNLEPYYE
jgi:predicted O-linked N-acetylglucosamine transferase (SPINDLY family)